MPYKREGSKVLHKKGNTWTVKQTCGSPAKAESAIRLLRGLESGSIKPSQVGKPRKKGK